MVDLAYDWGLMGWGMRAIVIVLAVALILVVLSPHVAVLKPIAEGLGLTTTKYVYVPVNHTVYVNQTVVKYVYVNETVPVYINRTVYVSELNPFPINHTVVKYVNQTIVRYINQTVPVYINRTVYVSVNPFHVNYTCQLYVYVIQHNTTVTAYGYTIANLSVYKNWIPSCSLGYSPMPFLAAIYSVNNSVTAPSVYVRACYNGTYTIFLTPPGQSNELATRLPVRPSPTWNGTWILVGTPPVIPPPAESMVISAFPCNVTVYIEK